MRVSDEFLLAVETFAGWEGLEISVLVKIPKKRNVQGSFYCNVPIQRSSGVSHLFYQLNWTKFVASKMNT